MLVPFFLFLLDSMLPGDQMQESQSLDNGKVFEQFFLEYHQRLVLYALKYVKGYDQASDLVQEVFLKLWENKSELEVNRSLKAYVFKTLRNHCLNYIEQQKIRTQHHQSIHDELKDMEIEFFNAETSLLQKEMGNSVMRALSNLPDDYSKVLRLSRIDGLKNKEIAEELNMPVRTVETRIYRGIRMLRDNLSRSALLFIKLMSSNNKKS
ncbi:RNA polymerase sigma-70 factor [Marinilabiliaceae bacterium JC017]|nr:RNA polymerase sigma-70 factor [Marinilabiliaceae bacterium JC017]